jgi:hypothetical protein
MNQPTLQKSEIWNHVIYIELKHRIITRITNQPLHVLHLMLVSFEPG